VVPFCDPVGWVESFGPVLGPILAALSVVFYPVALLYQSYLMAAATGQMAGAIVQGGIALVAVVYFVVVAVLLLVVAVVGVVLLCCLAVLLFVVLRGLLEPAPINEPWTPRRWPGRSARVG
jgi:hypothetical protein